jgi:hypothetical protein
MLPASAHLVIGDVMQVIVPERVPADAVVYCDPPYLMSERRSLVKWSRSVYPRPPPANASALAFRVGLVGASGGLLRYDPPVSRWQLLSGRRQRAYSWTGAVPRTTVP